MRVIRIAIVFVHAKIRIGNPIFRHRRRHRQIISCQNALFRNFGDIVFHLLKQCRTLYAEIRRLPSGLSEIRPARRTAQGDFMVEAIQNRRLNICPQNDAASALAAPQGLQWLKQRFHVSMLARFRFFHFFFIVCALFELLLFPAQFSQKSHGSPHTSLLFSFIMSICSRFSMFAKLTSGS